MAGHQAHRGHKFRAPMEEGEVKVSGRERDAAVQTRAQWRNETHRAVPVTVKSEGAFTRMLHGLGDLRNSRKPGRDGRHCGRSVEDEGRGRERGRPGMVNPPSIIGEAGRSGRLEGDTASSRARSLRQRLRPPDRITSHCSSTDPPSWKQSPSCPSIMSYRRDDRRPDERRPDERRPAGGRTTLFVAGFPPNMRAK